MALCATLLFSIAACGGGGSVPIADAIDNPPSLAPDASVKPDNSDNNNNSDNSDNNDTNDSDTTAPDPSSDSDTSDNSNTDTPDVIPAPTSPPADQGRLVPASFFGMHIAAQLAEGWPSAPFGTQRIWDSWPNVGWTDLHTGPGTFNWAPLDNLVNDSVNHGVELVYTFGYVPRWASSNPDGDCSGASPGSCYAPSLTAWREFVNAITTRYQGRIKYWELWNEPDAGNFWKGSHQQMADMVKQAYPIIKNIGGIVLSPAPQGMNAHNWLDAHFAAAGTGNADIVAFHGYVHGAPETLQTLVNNIRSVQNKHGIGTRPLWDTEHSWGNTSWPMGADEDQQAAWLARYLPISFSLGIERSIWYGWEHFDWGTLYDRTTKRVLKPGIAYGEVHKWMAGARFSPCEANAGLYQCKLSRNNGYEGVIVWHASGSTQVTVPQGFSRVRTIDAQVQTVSPGAKVSVGMKPILIEK